MAMACLRLVTFFPLRPLFSLPSFISRISRSTCLPTALLYLRPELFFDEAFFAGLFLAEVRFIASLRVLFLLEDFFAGDLRPVDLFLLAFLVAIWVLPPVK